MLKRFQILWITILLGFLLVFPSSAFAQPDVPDPGDWVDDLTQDVEFMVDEFWYNLLKLHSELQWFLMRTVFVLGIVIDLVTKFIAERLFTPLIAQSNSQFGIAVSMSFTIAMLVLGLSYLIAHFIRFQVVDLRSALTWYVLAALFFQLGPELYQGMNSLRSDINSFFYATALQSIQDSGSPLTPLNNNLADDGVPMFEPCDNFGWLSGEPAYAAGQGVDGLDIAMAYMQATSHDVLGTIPTSLGNCFTPNPMTYGTSLPFHWYYTDGYFDTAVSPPTWEFIPTDDRQRSLDMAAAAQYRLLGAWPLLWLGVFEKLVYLLITFAQGLSFITFSIGCIFAFFKRTEAIARSVVDLWIEIIVSSVVIALGQSLIVSLALAAAATQNPLASIGVGMLCAILMFVLLLAGMKLVWNALTRIFGSISQATGGVFVSPQQVMTGATVGAVGTVAAVVTGGGALALAGAAMAGMSASGVGGSAVGMAGSQLMMAGRYSSMAGVRRVGGAGAQIPAQALLPSANVVTGQETPVTASQNVLPVIKRTAAQPVVISGYDTEGVPADSVIGRRTSRITGQFTSMETPFTTAQAQRVLTQDSLRDDSAAQARLEADNVRDDAALRTTLHTAQDRQRTSLDTTGLERAGRDLSSAAAALKTTANQQQTNHVIGQMDFSGRRNIGAILADAVDVERDYRRRMDKPMLEGAGETFSGRMAQAVGIQPLPGQPAVSDAARFNAVGDQALRLGLNGNQIIQVLRDQAQSNGQSISPQTSDHLIQQVQQTTGLPQNAARQQVAQFVTLTATMPEQVRISGAVDPDRLNKNSEEK